MGQAPRPAPQEQVEDHDLAIEAIEEVVVRGSRRQLHAMKLAVETAQEKVYELFNVYNRDDDLDIHCSRERRIGSHFDERVCRARYVDEATSRAGREVVRSIQTNCPGGLTACPAAGATFDNATSIFQDEYAILPQMDVRLQDEVRRIVRENSEFAKSLAEYRAKEREYRDAVQRAAARRRE